MRTLVLLLPLALASAADTPTLDEAVKGWASDNPELRDLATSAVAAHLRRELAPILKAMQADDPEVRRRARAALEGLLPPGTPQPQQEEPQQGQVVVINNRGAGGQIRLVVRQGQGGAVVFHGAEDEETQQLKAKGIEGQPVDDPLMREQLRLAEGRGFAVTAVEKESAAERLGIRVKDILLSADGRPLKQPADVLKALEAERPVLTLLRRGKIVALGEGASGEGR